MTVFIFKLLMCHQIFAILPADLLNIDDVVALD